MSSGPRLCPSSHVSDVRPHLEELETRVLPSTLPWTAHPDLQVRSLGTGTVFQGYIPSQIRTLYGFDKVAATGAGQTIAIVDAYDDPNLVNDLIAFDQRFNLPGQSAATVGNYLTRLDQTGGTNRSPADAGWAFEIALDVEWAHAIAPDAHLVLVEAASNGGADLLSAIDTARNYPGVGVVSMSFGGQEFASEANYDPHFRTPTGHTGITFVASSGDSGAANGVSWPAVSPGVLAVGGTTLSPAGVETGWSDSGGGFSQFESRPWWQPAYKGNSHRTNPDVSYAADPATGFQVLDTFAAQSGGGWYEIGGTSAVVPQWAALLALVDQVRMTQGLGTLANAQEVVYTLPASDFHDITSGWNGYSATVGYDLVTGRGSPCADLVVAALAASGASSTGSSSASSNHAVTGSVGPHVLGGVPSNGVPAAQPTPDRVWSNPLTNSPVSLALAETLWGAGHQAGRPPTDDVFADLFRPGV